MAESVLADTNGAMANPLCIWSLGYVFFLWWTIDGADEGCSVCLRHVGVVRVSNSNPPLKKLHVDSKQQHLSLALLLRETTWMRSKMTTTGGCRGCRCGSPHYVDLSSLSELTTLLFRPSPSMCLVLRRFRPRSPPKQ